MQPILTEHYPERTSSELVSKLGADPEASGMLHGLLLQHAFIPDVVFTNTARSYAAFKFNALLEALNRVREAAPAQFFYVYIEGSGLGSESDTIYLMKSSDGVHYEVATWETGVEAFCSECEIPIMMHNMYPADDPRAQEIAGRLGISQLGEAGPSPAE
jgi:hypothetical protein